MSSISLTTFANMGFCKISRGMTELKVTVREWMKVPSCLISECRKKVRKTSSFLTRGILLLKI